MRGLQGFEEFVVARQDASMHVALGLTRDVHLDEGLCQNSLLRLYPRWQQVSGRDDRRYLGVDDDRPADQPCPPLGSDADQQGRRPEDVVDHQASGDRRADGEGGADGEVEATTDDEQSGGAGHACRRRPHPRE